MKHLSASFVMLAFFVSTVFGLSGTIVDECGKDIMSYNIYINGVSMGRFSNTVFYIPKDSVIKKRQQPVMVFSATDPVMPSETIKPMFFSLNGKRVAVEGQLARGVWLVKTAAGIKARVVFDGKPSKEFAAMNRTDHYGLAKMATAKDTAYHIEFRGQFYGPQSFTVSNPDTILNVRIMAKRTTFISELRKDEISYFLVAKDTSELSNFYLFHDGNVVAQQIQRLATDFKIRVFESGSYIAKFAQKYRVDNKDYYLSPYTCNLYGWDTLAFRIDQPVIDDKPNFTITDDSVGLGKVARYKVFDSTGAIIEKTVFFRKTAPLSVTLRKPFHDPKTFDTIITVEGGNTHPDYDYFHFGNPNGRKVLVIYSLDCSRWAIARADSGVYEQGELMSLAKADFFSRDTVDTTRFFPIAKEKVGLETHDFHVFVVRTTDQFFSAIYSLPDSVNLFYFYGHGSRNCISMDLSKNETIFKDRLLSVNSDTLNQLRSRFSNDCIGYFCSCAIAEDYQLADNCFAETFSHVFQIPLYGSTIGAGGVQAGTDEVRGAFRLITPDMYKE